MCQSTAPRVPEGECVISFATGFFLVCFGIVLSTSESIWYERYLGSMNAMMGTAAGGTVSAWRGKLYAHVSASEGCPSGPAA